jgi:hypothetical protein
MGKTVVPAHQPRERRGLFTAVMVMLIGLWCALSFAALFPAFVHRLLKTLSEWG